MAKRRVGHYNAIIMARPVKLTPSARIVVTTTPQVGEYLDDIVMAGLYGATRAEVAKTLVIRGIEDLIDKGIIKVRSSERPGARARG